MSPEVRAQLDKLDPATRARLLAHIRQQRQEQKQGDSSAGLGETIWPEHTRSGIPLPAYYRSPSDWR